MKREYIIETNEGKIYPLGVTKTPGGFDVAFVSQKNPALLLLKRAAGNGSPDLHFRKCPYGGCAFHDGKRGFYRSGICL